jgi:hypothetical protein
MDNPDAPHPGGRTSCAAPVLATTAVAAAPEATTRSTLRAASSSIPLAAAPARNGCACPWCRTAGPDVADWAQIGTVV